MLVLAFPRRAPSASATSTTYWRVSRRVIRRIWRALSQITASTRRPSRPPDDSRIHTHDVALSDQRDLALTAHDCLTLLDIMVRCADAMRHPEAEDDFLEFRRAADRMDHVAQQLISPHPAEMVTPKPVDLNRLIVECEGLLKRAVAPDIALRLELGAGEGSAVRARRWDLERILLHLVVNAARGMVLGGVVVVETSSTHGVRPSVNITVSGSPTAPTSSARMIPRSSTSSQDHGDLGLAAVARFVQRLNGVLQFESDSERRTRIEIDLPLASDSRDDPA
jgi:signal transduction histidine kinase